MHTNLVKGALFPLVLLAIPIVPFLVVGELPGERWLDLSGQNATLFGIMGAALLAGDIFLPVPSSIVGTLMGARLGFFAGASCIWIGLMAGSMVGYAAGRLFPQRFIPRMSAAPTLLVVFLSRPVPVLAEVTSLAAGAARLAIVPFILLSAFGNAIFALALAGNGASLLPEQAVGPGLALCLILPGATWFVWWLYRRRKKTGGAN
ncbi:MAG: putative membrane protein YdjX (TVP38/TMEM64 family) [Alphaproteobacteria bacterium]|jgi:uncharacterized membrane protein YdjX (TVP38/TMEM64 family)